MSPTEVEQLAWSVGLDPVEVYSWGEREAWSVVFDENELRFWFGDDQETFAWRLAGLPEAVGEALQVGIECVEWRRERTAEDLRGEIFFTAAMYLDKLRDDELATMPYDDYLETDEWRTRAERTKARFDNRCALCNRSGPLHAHHRTYERRGRELDGDLVALCPRCHYYAHEFEDLVAPFEAR
jgi:hypothetical protein